MKKPVIFSIVFTLICVGIIGCNKDCITPKVEEVRVSNEFGVSTDGKLLVFETLEDYEKAIDDENAENRERLLSEIASQNFKNYFSVQRSDLRNGENGQEMDDFLGQLLNKDGAIQIGEHIFKIDLATDQVFVIKSVNKRLAYEDLVKGNTNNKNVTKYSVDQEVLYLVNGEAEEKCGGINGFDEKSDIVNLDNAGNIKFHANAKFFRAGIYFRVTGSVYYTQQYSGTAKIALEIKGPEAWMRRRPCGAGTVTTHHAGERVSGYHYRYLFEAYAKARNLNGIHFYVRARAELEVPGYPTIVKYTNWDAGRNVNSPY